MKKHEYYLKLLIRKESPELPFTAEHYRAMGGANITWREFDEKLFLFSIETKPENIDACKAQIENVLKRKYSVKEATWLTPVATSTEIVRNR